MSVLLRIVYFNDIIIPLVAILCNLLLLWLIKTVKTKNLIHINYSLVPNSIIDIVASIVTFIAAPHFFQIGGDLYVVIGDLFGSLEIFDERAVSHVISLFGGLLFTNMVSITISFYVRYLVICKYHTISIRTMIIPYFILFLVFVTFYLLLLWFYLFSNDLIKSTDATLITNFWSEEFGRSPMFISHKILSVSFLCNFGIVSVIVSIQVALIFYFSKQISKTLKTHIESSSNINTKLLHKQIQRTLFIQAVGPSVMATFPVLLVIFKSLSQIKSNEISLILSLIFPWISICDPIATLIMIKPYRNHIKAILKCLNFKKFGKTSKIISAAQINN